MGPEHNKGQPQRRGPQHRVQAEEHQRPRQIQQQENAVDPETVSPPLAVEQNLACLCRKHHRLKTEGYWTVTQLGSGRLQWTNPHGSITVTEPNGPFTDPDDEHNHNDHDTSDGLTLRDLAYRNGGRTAEDDLAYLLDSHVPPGTRHPEPRIPAGPILVIDLDDPPPF